MAREEQIMATIDDLLEQAKQLTPEQQRELKDRLAESLEEEGRPAAETLEEEPYASLLRSAGTAHAIAPAIARQKNKHLAEICAPPRAAR